MYNFIKIAILLLQILINVNGDYQKLQNCAKNKNCWPNLNDEMFAVISDNIKNDTKACDNFWLYACGNWQAPLGQQHVVDNFGIAIENYERQLKETNYQKDEVAPFGNLAATLTSYYEICNQAKFKTEAYLSEIGKMLKTNWPVWHEAVLNKTAFPSNFNWLALLAELRRFGLNDVIFKERATTAFNDAKKHVVELALPAEDEAFAKKFELVNYLIEFKLANGVTDELWNLAAEIFELETQIKELRVKYMTEAEAAGVANLVESFSLNELKLKVPNVDWQLYFNILLQQAHVEDLSTEITGIDYFQKVATLMAQTDERIVGFYILLHLCKYLLEIRIQTSKPNHCIRHMNVVMPLGMNLIYKHFLYENRQQDEAALQQIFKQLKLQYANYLQRNKMNLSGAQIAYLQEKAEKMAIRLGNLPLNFSYNDYNHYYDAVNITASNFEGNHLQILNFRFAKQHFAFAKNRIGNVEQQLVGSNFYVYDDIVQIRSAPYFVHEQNLLIVPMVFMQLPFFHHRLQPLLQHSLVAFILGHEFNHAFEYEGIIVDALGNENSIGFDITKQTTYQAGVKCFQQTPTLSLIERMADVNGFQLAFDAYFNGYKNGDDGGKAEIKRNDISSDDGDDDDNAGNKRNLKVFGNISALQIYFLNFAQFFCGSLPEPIDHDRDDVRVNEIVKNMPEFRLAFDCANNRNIEECHMWR